MALDFRRFNRDMQRFNAGLRSYSDVLIEQSLRVWTIKSRVGLFFLSLLVSLAATYFLTPEAFTRAQEYTLFIFFFSICLWITEAIPPFAVGILVMGFLVYTMGTVEGATLSPAAISNTWSDSVIWIFLGGFFLSEGMRKTYLDIALFRTTIRIFGTKPDYVLLGVMMVTSVLSMIISNTATAAMILAAVSVPEERR